VNDLPIISREHRVVRVLGQGGMGVVYEAEHLRLGRRVALKVLSEDSGNDPTALARLRREALTMSALQHPHIAQVSNFHEGPPPFLEMELLAGQSLRDRIARRGAMSATDACTVAIQLLSALGAAHRSGIIHRDVKPANVFIVDTPLTDVFVKLLDFGVAKLMTAQQGPALTSFDSVVGSAPYMAPEQIRGDAIDGRTDLFALGVTLYEMLAARRPFVAGPHENVMAVILRGGPIAPLASVPGALSAVVFRALSPTASMRYQTAEEMSEALLPFASREQLGAVETTATATVRAMRGPESRTEVDTRSVSSGGWSPPTLAATVDQTAGRFSYAGPSPTGTTAQGPSFPHPGPSHPGLAVPQPAPQRRFWVGPVLGGVIAAALVVVAGLGILGWWAVDNAMQTAPAPPLPPLPTSTAALTPDPIVASCTTPFECYEYTRFGLGSDTRSSCTSKPTEGVWRERACDRSRAVGGCRARGQFMTVWYFPPMTKQKAAESCHVPAYTPVSP
jgi:eukaryotic-like serine/threonine-protein kinase